MMQFICNCKGVKSVLDSCLIESPNNLNRIFGKHGIACDHRYLFGDALGNNQPVKRITVMKLKIDNRRNMIQFYGQYINSVFFKLGRYELVKRTEQFKLAYACFDGKLLETCGT